jgi:hypothetical protein
MHGKSCTQKGQKMNSEMLLSFDFQRQDKDGWTKLRKVKRKR